MLSKDKLSVEKIKQLADDIRVINGFVENHGFDGNLLSVNVSPQSNIRRIDRSILGLIVATVACLAIVLTKVLVSLMVLPQ